MASHVVRNLLIVSGVVLLLVQGALVVCWWKLPEWAPEWVIQHSPWPEPALRAWRRDPVPTMTFGRFPIQARLLDWGDAIGPALVREFEQGDPMQRLAVVALAGDLARQDGIAHGTEWPIFQRPPWNAAQVMRVRESLRHLVERALADGSSHLPENASYVAMSLQDERLVPPFCTYLAAQKPPIFEDLEPPIRFLGLMADARAVPVLIPLLPIRHRPHPTVEEALDRCLQVESLPHVIAATRHPHEVIRTWAARRFPRYHTAAELATRMMALLDDPERQVRVATAQSLAEADHQAAADRLLELARSESDLPVRIAAIEAVGELGYLPAAPVLRAIVAREQDDLRNEAIIALGDLADVEAFPLLMPLLTHDDRAVALKAHWALSQLELTAEQRRQVDAIWPLEATQAERAADEGPVGPTSPASPPAP